MEMEQCAFQKLNNRNSCKNKNTFYLETSGGQNFNPNLTCIHFMKTT